MPYGFGVVLVPGLFSSATVAGTTLHLIGRGFAGIGAELVAGIGAELVAGIGASGSMGNGAPNGGIATVFGGIVSLVVPTITVVQVAGVAVSLTVFAWAWCPWRSTRSPAPSAAGWGRWGRAAGSAPT